jgi:hypothetical protein
MSIPKINKCLTPIMIEQSTFNKFFPSLLIPKNHSLVEKFKERSAFFRNKRYTLKM